MRGSLCMGGVGVFGCCRRWGDSSDVCSSRRFVFCRCGVCVCVFSQCVEVLHKGEGMWSRADGPVCIRIYAVVAGVRVGSSGLSGCWSLIGRGALCVWELCVFVVVCAGGVGCCSSGWGLF